MTAIIPEFDSVKTLQDHNLEAALALAKRGAFVFPCKSNGGPELVKKPNAYWRSESTRDERAIRSMWRKHPHSMPGIDCGKSGIIVIDCDRKINDGLAWLEHYVAEHHSALDGIPFVETPSGGRHFVFRNTIKHGNGRGNLPPKSEADIDVRGDGGYIVGPGSHFTDGSGEYIENGDILSSVDAPLWMSELLVRQVAPIAFTLSQDFVPSSYGEVALNGIASELASKHPGERNVEANRLAYRAGQLIGSETLDEGTAREALESAALSWGIRPNDKALGRKGTINRAIQAGQKSPRGPRDSTALVDVRILPHDEFDPATGEVFEPGAGIAPDGELPEWMTRVPGLVGELADWITDCAMYPQPALSLGAALAIVGTAAGRHLAGPTKSGTHLYVITLAPSGSGKDHPLTMIAPILSAAGLREHIGPSQFISMPAVINFLVRKPLSVCAMDEFGSFLKRINNKRASGFEGAISGMMRTAWGCSFKAMATPEWAQRPAETVFSPAMSIYGAVTAEEFYASMEGADVTNGVLNRFLVIETKQMPEEVRPRSDSSDVPTSVIKALSAIYNRPGVSMLCQSTVSPAFERLGIAVGAEEMRRAMVRSIRAQGISDPINAPFYARAAENAIRLATIVAIGDGKREVDEQTMAWARDFALWSAGRLAQGARLYIADSETQGIANAVRRALEGRGRVKRRDLIRTLAHRYKTRELDDAIKLLSDAEQVTIEKHIPPNGGTPTFWYSITKNPA